MLQFKVQLINEANKHFNIFAETLTNDITPYVGSKIVNKDGNFTKKLEPMFYKHYVNNDEVKLRAVWYKDYNGWVSVEFMYQLRDHNDRWVNHTISRTIGKVEDGILVKLTQLPVYNTDLTVDKAQELQDRIELLQKELRQAENDFRQYVNF